MSISACISTIFNHLISRTSQVDNPRKEQNTMICRYDHKFHSPTQARDVGDGNPPISTHVFMCTFKYV